MAGFKDFREIVAWQLARELRLLADALLAKPELKRRFKYAENLHDAARSGPRNIAEGFGRFFHKVFANHVRIAKGSENEVLDAFIDAHENGIITKEEFAHAEDIAVQAMKTAAGLIRYLESTPDPPPPKYLPKMNLDDPDFGQD